MNFKKIMATVTSFVLVGSILAGCTDTNKTTTTANTTSAVTTTAETTGTATTTAETKIESKASSVAENVNNAVSTADSKIGEAVSNASDSLNSIASTADSKASSVADNVKDAVSNAGDSVNNAISTADSKVDGALSVADSKIDGAVSNATSVASSVADNVENAVSNASSKVDGAVSNATSVASSVAGNVENAVSNASNSLTPAVNVNTNVKMGLSTDEGGRGDKSFNDAAIAGLDRIEKEFGIKPVIIESKEASQYAQNLESIANTSDLIIGVGFKMTSDINNVAQMYPEKNFLLIDGVAEAPNVKNVLFKEQEGSFLLGVIAGKMTKTGKVGFIGGVEGDVIGRFEAGFVAGVYSVNPEAGKLLADRTMVRYAGNFSDADKGAELAKDLYNSGADIIFHAAGGVGIGLFNAAKEMNKFAMGVDSDQAAMIPDKKDVILVSMMKKVDVATYEAAKELIEGRFTPGTTSLGLKEDAVGLSPTLHPELAKNEEVLKLVEEYKAKIASGEQKVPATVAELKDFVK